MSDLQLVQEGLEDIQLEPEELGALQDGFAQLGTPSPTQRIETNVKQALASGTDFDPLYRQAARRIAWTLPPALSAFLLVSWALAAQPMPRFPLTAWLANYGERPYQLPASAAEYQPWFQGYSPPPLRGEMQTANGGFNTTSSGPEAPEWFKKRKVAQQHKSVDKLSMAKPKGKVTKK